MKPHKGVIESWVKVPIPFKIGLKYFIVGVAQDHPDFGGCIMRTSVIVSRKKSEIETLNSKYTLGNKL